jgi:hypothetical protein
MRYQAVTARLKLLVTWESCVVYSCCYRGSGRGPACALKMAKRH